MRKYILIALVLVVIAIGVSLVLIPGNEEVAVMQARDVQTVATANIDVEAEYAQGRRTFPIVSGLADKRIAEGNRPEAIRILEEYVTANPNDVQGRKKLAEQYQLAGENAKYNEQLEAIAAADPTPANLRVLSDIYNADKNYPKQEEVLSKLLDVTKGEDAQVFVDLATIQVVNGKKEEALKTVADLKAKHPTFESYAVVRIEVNILAEKGEIDAAYNAAKAWVERPIPAATAEAVAPQVTPPSGEIASPVNPASQRAKELADLTNILHYSGHADKAVALVEPHLQLLEQSTELVVAYVNANITIGREDHAWDILTKIDEAGRMTPELYHPYLQLAIKREDTAAAEAIATNMDVTTFNEEQALNIIELARAMDAQSTLDILLNRFGEATIVQDKPVLDAVIAILKNAKEQDSKIETALNVELSSVQRLRLAEACARASKKQCFDTIVARFPAVADQTPAQIAEYAQLFIIANRSDEVIEPVGQRAAAADAHPDVIFAHIKLAAASGREDITKPWLEPNANSAPIQKLHELFYIASDRNRNAVASDIAERLFARDPSPMNREIMIAALIKAGEHAKALPLLREQIGQDGSNDGLYLATLNKVARSNAEARKELTDYAQASLQSGRGDERQQINYAYILLNNGKRDVAMPFISNNAKTKGGEWRTMQAQLNRVGGKGTTVKLSREQRIAIANNPRTSAATKRDMAFGLMNDGHKADATKIFEQLAANKGPDSQEVKDLMYLWGGKLNAQQIAWLQNRAANANPYDKERWGELINNYGDDNAVVNYVSTTPDALYNPALRKKYFRVVATSGNRDNYDARMRDWVAQTTDVPALLDYAEVAKSYGYSDAATNAYTRVEQLDPANAKALAALSAANMAKGSYSRAEQYVDRALASPANENPTQTHFYKAELLKRQGNLPAAQAEYAQVVQTTNPAASGSDALSRLYTAQFHLGQHAEAKAGFERLLATNPDDKGVLADYMSVLIEYKYFDDATRIANQYDKSSPYYGRTSAIHGQSSQVSSIQRLSGGREMKIGFAGNTEGKPPVDMQKLQQLAWVESAELGYDSLSISAKPGYVVRFVPTNDQQFAVVPAQSFEVAQQMEQDRQAQLRLQLLYARIEQETGQSERAKQRLAALRQYYPNEPQLIGYTASVEAAEGNTQEAIELYQIAQGLAPENEDYGRTVADLKRGGSGMGGARNIAQFLKIDHEYRNFGANHEHISTLSGQARIGERTELGFNLMNDRVNPKGFQDPATGFVTRESDNFQAGEIYVGHYLDNGDRVQVSAFANEDTPGAGLYYSFGNALGRTELLGEYHKPYWDFPEAVYGIASRDRVGAKHFGNINPTLTYGLETSLNNYNVEVQDNAAQTGLIRVSLQQQIQPQTEDQPYLGVGYGFDGEYLFDKPDDRLINGVGPGTYRPFPFRSRENHQLSGIYRDDWTDSTHVLLLGGYLVDRLGDHGPVVEGRLNQDITDSLEAGVRGRYGLATTANGSATEDDAVNLGAHLMYKF